MYKLRFTIAIPVGLYKIFVISNIGDHTRNNCACAFLQHQNTPKYLRDKLLSCFRQHQLILDFTFYFRQRKVDEKQNLQTQSTEDQDNTSKKLAVTNLEVLPTHSGTWLFEFQLLIFSISVGKYDNCLHICLEKYYHEI